MRGATAVGRPAAAMRGAVALAAVAAAAAQVDQRPQYHVMPPTGWLNDPNGPHFHALWKQYHLFFQCNPAAAVWGSISWCHTVSSDLVDWRHLPVALSPNNTYDANGVFSGSVTIVDGSPVAAYTCVGSDGVQRQCLAYPANTSDPDLVEWVKDAANPVIPAAPAGTQNNNFRDDTTAWRDDAAGVWLMAVGNQQPNNTGVVQLYSSPDFKTWTYASPLYSEVGLGMIECPDFFPLAGATTANGSAVYVLKMSAGPDSYYVGTYNAAARTFTPVSARVRYDFGQGYASKSFYDPVGQRQILWIWVAEEDNNGVARGWAGTQSLPRVITYDPPTGLLAINPLPELANLRNATLAAVTSPTTVSDGAVTLIPGAAGLMLEIDANFTMPTLPTASIEFGVVVRATADLSVQTRIGLIYAAAGVPANNTDRPGGDGLILNMDPTLPEAQNVANCSGMCAANASCPAWVYVRPGDGPCRCCLKTYVPPANPNAYCVSGVEQASLTLAVNRTGSGTDGNTATQSGLVPIVEIDGTTARLRVFVDHSIIEAFANNGRGRVTSRVYPQDPAAVAVGVYAIGGDVTLEAMTVWSMATIWVS